jgi:hypothetical protein
MENSRREGEGFVAMDKRICPGRLTFEEWQAVPFLKRLALIKRAQCDLLGSFRFCADKRCRRARTCCGDDPDECHERLWRLVKPKPKTLRREYCRIYVMRAW